MDGEQTLPSPPRRPASDSGRLEPEDPEATIPSAQARPSRRAPPPPPGRGSGRVPPPSDRMGRAPSGRVPPPSGRQPQASSDPEQTIPGEPGRPTSRRAPPPRPSGRASGRIPIDPEQTIPGAPRATGRRPSASDPELTIPGAPRATGRRPVAPDPSASDPELTIPGAPRATGRRPAPSGRVTGRHSASGRVPPADPESTIPSSAGAPGARSTSARVTARPPEPHSGEPGRTRADRSGGEDVDFDTGREVEARPAQRASNEPPDPLVGKELGGCRVKSLLGKGGMARVYLATQVDLEREVAVKVLSERLTRDPDQVEQFMREAKTLARLEHPNIVGVYSVGREEEPSLHYLVMQLVRGGSLKDVLTQRKRLEPDVACAYGAQIARGLHEAERAGVVHRDIKPGNILVAGDTLKITDFGLARMLDDPTLAFGQVVGTPHYMSPEQADSRAVDHRTDIYGLGATLYHLLVGEPPFSGGSIQEILLKHVNEEPVPPHKRLEGIPEGISRIVLRMLAKSPDARYASFREVVEALEAPTRGATQLPPPPEPLPAFLFDEQLPELAVDAVALRRERPLAFRLAPAALLAITCLVVGQGLGVVREVFADDSQQDTSALPPAERLAAAALQQLEPTLPALSRPEARRRLAALAEEHAGTEAAKAAAKRAAELKVAIDEAALAEVRKAIVAARDAEARGDLAAASKLLEGLDAEQRKLIGAADVEAFAAKIRAGLAARGVAYVPGGEFVIGFRDTSRRVRLDGFFIGLREVTADEYAELLAAQPDQPAPRGWDGRRPPVGKGNLPVTGVTLAQAEAYARWRGLRLPNYLEWEAAARGADGRRWPWGNDRRPKACNWSGRGLRGVRPPGSMPEDRSAWGCEDMAGNVAELACAPPGEAPEPWVCGGSYLTPLLEGAQGFFRRRVAADAAHEAVGFRLAGYPQPGGGGGR